MINILKFSFISTVLWWKENYTILHAAKLYNCDFIYDRGNIKHGLNLISL